MKTGKQIIAILLLMATLPCCSFAQTTGQELQPSDLVGYWVEGTEKDMEEYPWAYVEITETEFMIYDAYEVTERVPYALDNNIMDLYDMQLIAKLENDMLTLAMTDAGDGEEIIVSMQKLPYNTIMKYVDAYVNALMQDRIALLVNKPWVLMYTYVDGEEATSEEALAIAALDPLFQVESIYFNNDETYWCVNTENNVVSTYQGTYSTYRDKINLSMPPLDEYKTYDVFVSLLPGDEIFQLEITSSDPNHRIRFYYYGKQ